VSAAASLADFDAPPNLDGAVDEIRAATGEMEVRRALVDAERDAAAAGPVRPVHEFRVQAARRLMELEHGDTTCYDTDKELVSLARRLDPGPVLLRQFPSAYCVQRIRQLLAGHVIDHEAGAIRRLGLWTLLSLRWPLLAEKLAKDPEFIDQLTTAEPPDEDLARLLAQTAVGDWALAAIEAGLDADAVRRLAKPMRLCEPNCAVPPGAVVEQFSGAATSLRSR
jgi:hypothetical protein